MFYFIIFAYLNLLVFADETSTFQFATQGKNRDSPLNCEIDPCSEVLPKAVTFQKVPNKHYVIGLDENEEMVGWVALSTDVVNIKAYSGKPMVTILGLDTSGKITGVKVIHHSEPILLVGIPESRLREFVQKYVGLRANDRVVVGGSDKSSINVDAISGATVTVLTQNQTILSTASNLAIDVGAIDKVEEVDGHFVSAPEMSWESIIDSRALGHLVIEQSQMGLEADPQGRSFLDIWFGVVDAPQIGIPILGENTYLWAMENLESNEHLFVLLNSGSYSFRGSGFVRGGVFDRFRLEQGLSTITFRDLDYTRLKRTSSEGVPEFWEGGLFIARDGAFDPARSYSLVFLASQYETSKGGFEREFKTFTEKHRVPKSIYKIEGLDPELLENQRVWRNAWKIGWPKALAVTLFFFYVIGLLLARKWLTSSISRLKKIHSATLVISFLGLGVMLHFQPSVTQLLTLAGNVNGDWSWLLFLSEPMLFVGWILIAVTTLIWGRGLFCGWVCPFGALSEILFRIGRKLHFPEIKVPNKWHQLAHQIRYAVFLFLLLVFLYDSILGEIFAEIEPFKSTFFVLPWTRGAGLFLWWIILILSSVFLFRPFCQYLCPMGAALSIPSSLRMIGPRRRQFCVKCKICTRTCEYRAIDNSGRINKRSCFSCMECEANFRSDTVCPILIMRKRKNNTGKV
jgi:NosR/NirI family transcriptional regulator, nitrous oxide reductase regulator